MTKNSEVDRIVLPRTIDLAVVSYGGAGTSFLIRFLSGFLKTNQPSDSDGFKHVPLPPISFNPNIKYIYVHGNPQMAALSLFRRRYHSLQSRKLQRWLSNKAVIPKSMSLEEYAALGKDMFHFERHFDNWYDKYLAGAPVLFVRYEAIFDNVAKILDFAGIPASGGSKFPQKKERRTSLSLIGSDTLRSLDAMYGEFADKLNRLEDVELRCRGDRRLFPGTIVALPYLRAILGQAAYEARIRLGRMG